MIDITEITDDIKLFDSQVGKAANVLSVQLGELEYAQDLGIDLRYFLDEAFEFQNEAFKAYLMQRLAESSIDVLEVSETIEALYNRYAFQVSATDSDTSLMR